jgi:hypothetical protein
VACIEPCTGANADEIVVAPKKEHVRFAMALHVVRAPIIHGLGQNGNPQSAFRTRGRVKKLVAACRFADKSTSAPQGA